LDWIEMGKKIVEYMPYLARAKMYNIGRRLCATSTNHIGSVPHGSLVRDVICIFEGGRVPFVLRECGSGCY
jgi:hypothetical protein